MSDEVTVEYLIEAGKQLGLELAKEKAENQRLRGELLFCQAELEERIQILHALTKQCQPTKQPTGRDPLALLENALEAYHRLWQALIKHYSQRGNDKCWENDNELYAAFGLVPHNTNELPSYQEHCRNCDKYRQGLYGLTEKEPVE